MRQYDIRLGHVYGTFTIYFWQSIVITEKKKKKKKKKKETPKKVRHGYNNYCRQSGRPEHQTAEMNQKPSAAPGPA